MALLKSGGPFMLAARALGSASTLAHSAFAALYAWRMLSGHGFRIVSLFLAILAISGGVLSFVGGSLVRHGGRTKARSIGVWMVALSAMLASTLLVFTSFGD